MNRHQQAVLKRVQRRFVKPLIIVTSEKWRDEPNIVVARDDKYRWFYFPKALFTRHNIKETDIFSNFFIFYYSRLSRKKNIRGRLLGIKILTPAIILNPDFVKRYKKELKKYFIS